MQIVGKVDEKVEGLGLKEYLSPGGEIQGTTMTMSCDPELQAGTARGRDASVATERTARGAAAFNRLSAKLDLVA